MAPHPGDKAYDYTIRMFASIGPKLRSPEKKIADLNTMGLDMTILSIAPTQFFYSLEGNLASPVCVLQNDRIASIVHTYPDRFAGMATVPLQDVPAALRELRRIIEELELSGVEIGSNVNGRPLGDPIYLPFFEKVRELDVPIYIHPHNPAGLDRLRDYYFMNVIGFPLETTLTAGSLIFSGMLDRVPGLKIILAHGGGYLPYLIGRMDHAFKTRPECRDIRKPPSEYLKTFYYDTVTHGPSQLQFLLSIVGADHVVIGTDYPYDMGDLQPLETLHAVDGLTPEDEAKITGINAQELFKI